jgi:hypothetical protein
MKLLKKYANAAGGLLAIKPRVTKTGYAATIT